MQRGEELQQQQELQRPQEQEQQEQQRQQTPELRRFSRQRTGDAHQVSQQLQWDKSTLRNFEQQAWQLGGDDYEGPRHQQSKITQRIPLDEVPRVGENVTPAARQELAYEAVFGSRSRRVMATYYDLPDEILLHHVIPKLCTADRVVFSKSVDRRTRALVKPAHVRESDRLSVDDFVNSVARLRWAQEHRCRWDATTTAIAAEVGHVEVLEVGAGA